MQHSAKTLSRLLTLVVMLSATACESDEEPTDAGTDGGPSCSAESVGTQGCQCSAGDRCGTNESGEMLMCMGGICEAASCVSGDRGCVCRYGTECGMKDDACIDGFCRPEDCDVGEEFCACLGGTCDPGLVCQNGSICLDNTGHEGGACHPNNTCERGNRCDPTLGICVHCEFGSAGCQCTQAMACNSGLVCQAGMCVDHYLLPPDQPRCYTPCRKDLVSGDTVRTCDSDGLLEGCLDSMDCTDGSCVKAGAKKPTCATDLECPFFQTCLSGGCYSNCQVDADCKPGQGCHLKVCRTPCEAGTGSEECGPGFACDAEDGEHGFCSPVGDMADEPGVVPTGGFRLNDHTLEFSNIQTTLSFPIITDGPLSQEITIRKLRHTLFFADGKSEEVSAPTDPKTGEYVECDPAKGECPLFWLQLSDGENDTKLPTLTIKAPGDCEALGLCPEVTVSEAGGVEAVRWEGELELCSLNGCSEPITMTYIERPEGQWSGSLYYFGTFEDDGLENWMNSSDKSKANNVSNALIRKWADFRGGGLSGGWNEFLAILTSTREGSWNFGTVKERCNATLGACYPYTNMSGVRTYSDDLASTPIPTGEARFPVAMNLKVSKGKKLRGRIDSASALQYAADPDAQLNFEADPASAVACDSKVSATGDCAVFIEQFDADIAVGGRYYSDGPNCMTGYAAKQMPWLVEGFEYGTAQDMGTGLRYRYECRDTELPYDPTLGEEYTGLNIGLAGANPVPDGRERMRNLTLVDGALINQSMLFVLFREQFDTFIPGEPPVSAYGYMLLRKKPTTLEPDDFTGFVPPDVMKPVVQQGVTCTQDILDKTLVAPLLEDLGTLSEADLDSVVNELITGPDINVGWQPIPADWVHWFCEDTGLIDGGAGNDGGGNPIIIPCNDWSKVTYFSVDPAIKDQADIAALPCNELPNAGPDEDASDENDTDSCHDTVQGWRDNIIDIYEPLWRCTDPDDTFCDPEDGKDFLADKTFYEPMVGMAEPLPPILSQIDQAFRYKTRFQSQSGGQIGFAPQECIPNSDQIPYCYEPPVIEEIRSRVDCLIDIYTNHAPNLSQSVQTTLNTFLRESFSSFKEKTLPFDKIHDGFERLYAELLVMLGDDALTAAFASRFDLAGANGAAFEGSLFEDNGMDLTGVAGFEMVSLYRAVQYYQLALDRLYLMGPNYAAALGKATTDDVAVFVSPATVTDYLERLTRAATQKARAWGEIAKHYQEFNRADLARAVIERSYTGTYLESVLLSNLMIAIKKKSADKSLDQIRIEIEKAQLRYRMALLDMRDIYETITDSVTYFGFAPDYIPFPALDAGNVRDTNAYEVLAAIAKQKVDLAKQRELTALESNRTQKTDAATFQAELVRVRNTYENQLADICGTFTGDDNNVYPAIKKYAHYSDETTLLGDPCGRMGNGQLHNAIVGVDDARIGLRTAMLRHANILSEITIEQGRVAEQCELIEEIAQLEISHRNEVIDFQEEIGNSRNLMNAIQREVDSVVGGLQTAICEPPGATSVGTCASAIPTAIAQVALTTAANINMSIQESRILDKEIEIAEAERDHVAAVMRKQCEAAEIDSLAKVASLRLGIKEAELEAIRANYGIRLQLAEVIRLANQAQRWLSQQEQAEQLLIDVEAARNDPNVRIYRNDAVINADIAFDDAIRAVYRTTRVFEYYTSQSYEKRDQLFLIRMVTAGQYNLENYLIELQNSFFDFEEQFGVPDSRVQILSLRDDIMQVPLVDGEGNPYSRSERIDIMRERLRDVNLLDSNGYLTIPFSTTLDALSPLTRNHKIRFIEADIVGSDVGDTVGRIYLRAAGTGVIHNVDDFTDYYVFPERTAVIDTFFNGNRVFDPDVYRSFRHRDRPLVNTLWEFAINQRDEAVNTDIDLQSLSDVRLLVHYSDFTTF